MPTSRPWVRTPSFARRAPECTGGTLPSRLHAVVAQSGQSTCLPSRVSSVQIRSAAPCYTCNMPRPRPDPHECGRDECLVLTWNVKYCSRNCAAIVNNAGQRRHGEAPRSCLNPACVETVPAFRKGYTSGYHSLECKQDHEIVLWLAGDLDGSIKYTTAAYVRRYLDKRSGGRCEGIDSRTDDRCIEDRVTTKGRSVLQIDHIDGNWRNNRVENVRLLCPTCHVLTDTWGAGNMGKGRTWKAKYNQFQSKSKSP